MYRLIATCLALLLSLETSAAVPDIASVPPDLSVPEMADEPAAPGRRVRHMLPEWKHSEAYHALYLPSDWKAGTSYTVIIEYAGNGNYKNAFGDVSTGRPEGSKLGYGISAGVGSIWVCVPFLNATGDRLAITWWGDAPEYSPDATLRYLRDVVAMVCKDFGGDAKRVLLCGFSRGAIACNRLGLNDDITAKLWRGFVAYSHYDGVRKWPYTGSDKSTASDRIKRLDGRPQFICHEGDAGPDETRKYLATVAPDGKFEFAATGFRNHNDAWVLRPCKARQKLRDWYAKHMGGDPAR